MSDTSQSPYKPMYKVKPYFVIRKLKLPDCMYLLQPIHKLPSMTSDEVDYNRALDSLEVRQEKIFSRIRELQDIVVKTGRDAGLTSQELQRLTESYVPEDTPLDVVVTTPPSCPPYPILALYQYIRKNISTCLKSFVHSSATGRVDPCLTNLFNDCTTDNPKLKITIIWKVNKDYSEPTMMYAPGKQIPVSGIANICRFLSRQFCPEVYESLDHTVCGQTDYWLDSLSIAYLHGNAKEKGSVLRQLNSALGNKDYVTGTCPTLADIVLFSIIGNDKGLKMSANVKNWMNCCHRVQEMKYVPCLYLQT